MRDISPCALTTSVRGLPRRWLIRQFHTQSFMLEMVCDMSWLRVLQIKYVYVRIVNLINIKLAPIVAIAPEQGLMVGLRTTTLG